MTRPRRVRHRCPLCGERVRVSRKARRFYEHRVAWFANAPRCDGSGVRYVPVPVAGGCGGSARLPGEPITRS